MRCKSNWQFFVSVFGLIVSLLSADSAAYGADPMSSWRVQWEKTIAAAKKEGQLTLYASSGYNEVFAEFKKKYPEIKIVYAIGGGTSLSAGAQRLMAERRAGKFLGDLYVNGLTTGSTMYRAKALDPIKPVLILPEVIDESKWWRGQHRYVDPEGQYLFPFNGQARVEVCYNTNLVKSESFKSYWDILRPDWKGKIVGFDPRHPTMGTTLRFLYYNPQLGPKFIRQLYGGMEIVLSRDSRQIADWLAVGKFALAVASPTRLDLPEAKEQGLPVGWFHSTSFEEGAALTAGPGGVALINRAPHPNAAKLALNWLLSRDGQVAFQNSPSRANTADSLRIDIPKDRIRPENRRVEGARLIVTDRAEWMDMQSIRKLIRDVMQGNR